MRAFLHRLRGHRVTKAYGLFTPSALYTCSCGAKWREFYL
jgi:hypothetical protein